MFWEPLKDTPPIVLGVVNVAAEPVVSWLPASFTPGRSMFWEPLKDTPPIVLGVVRVAAEPDHTPPDRVPVPSVILVPDTAPVNIPAAPDTSPLNIPVPPADTLPIKVPATPDTTPLAVIVVVDKAPIIWASF